VPGGADAWFATEKVAAGTWLVGESSHVNCFLIEGTDRAVLVDTGLGIADIGRAVRRLTDKPLLVVNTHSHSDHRGGNWRFADVAAHPLAVRSLTQPVAQDHLTAYLEVAREQLAAYRRPVLPPVHGDDKASAAAGGSPRLGSARRVGASTSAGASSPCCGH
jgi:glyoxylase-like metal-dependent hydrolase (beta-lactamase superfamily II)